MNRLLQLVLISVVALSAGASLPESGYYRVQNGYTKRYVYVRDNKGEINVGATTADYDAIWLIMGEERPHFDPSGIIRLNHKDKNSYDIEGQGTSVYDLIEMYPCIYEMTPGVYKIGGTAKGTTKYLSDGEANLEEELSWPRDAGGASAVQRQRWSIYPVADSYFGIAPTVDAGGKHYTTFYADFEFTPQSSDMKIYTVVKAGQGLAALREVTGTVECATPVVIECPATSYSDNRITIGGDASANTDDNLLTGVYFENTLTKKHWNTVNYDPETMRILGVTSNGELGFVKAPASLKYIPANTAYLKVAPSTEAELRLVSEEEYENLTGIEITIADSDAPIVSVAVEDLDVTLTCSDADVDVEICDLAGRIVARTTTPSTVTLPAHGIYIVRTPSGVRKLSL